MLTRSGALVGAPEEGDAQSYLGFDRPEHDALAALESASERQRMVMGPMVGRKMPGLQVPRAVHTNAVPAKLLTAIRGGLSARTLPWPVGTMSERSSSGCVATSPELRSRSSA